MFVMVSTLKQSSRGVNVSRPKLRGAGYYFIGPSKHSAVKVCHYTKKDLAGEGVCYKNVFYGIRSHRCLQWTPCQPFCTQACRFCWRDISLHDFKWQGSADAPKALVDEAVEAQKFLLNGFGGDARVRKERLAAAFEPIHAAISLDGEPTLYPRLGELIKEFHSRGITTFLVSNGTVPEAFVKLIEEGALPTQLYVSLPFFDEASYNSICQPLVEGGFEKVMQSLDLMKKLRGKTRTVLRMTLIRDVNLSNAADYAKLIMRSGADYVEVKAYVAVGKSRQRVGVGGMPSHEEITVFARELAGETGYVYTSEHVPSRVVLLCRDDEVKEKRFIDFKSWCGERFTKFERRIL